MRILIALDDGEIANAVESLVEIAGEHEVVISCPEGAALGLALGNSLPDRDVVTVLSQVVVSADDLTFVAPSEALSSAPIAIVELRSVRGLVAAGSLVICACDEEAPVVVGADGTMRGVDAVVDGGLVGALLARRLEVDLFLILIGGAPNSAPAKEEAARRFVEATGRRAAIGELEKAVEIVRGASGTQISAQRA